MLDVAPPSEISSYLDDLRIGSLRLMAGFSFPLATCGSFFIVWPEGGSVGNWVGGLGAPGLIVGATITLVFGSDNGDINRLEAMRTYHEVGFDGPMIPDHYPHMVGHTPEAHRTAAHAIGDMKAMMTAAEDIG